MVKLVEGKIAMAKKSKAILLYSLNGRSHSQTRTRPSVPPLYLMTSEIWGDPSRSPRGPDSTDSLLHTDVIANEESQGWLVPDS